MRSPLEVTVFLCLFVATSACKTTQASGGGTARSVEGQVEKVGKDDGTLTLRVGEERREILVAPEAEIRIDDFRGTFEDIKEGQRVRASLDETGPQDEGFRIEILDQGGDASGDTGEREAPEGSASPGDEGSSR